MGVPSATYQLQFGPDFDFNAALNIAGYPKELGIDTLCASPVFESGKASSGYDITDPAKRNRRLGGYTSLKKLSARLKERGMGYLQDTISNHMAYREQNRLIADLFKQGKKSAYYRYFDIDWNHHNPGLKGKVLTPFLALTYQQDSLVRDYIDRRMEKISGDYKLYFSLLDKQVYKLSYWKVATEQINYRRFFTINHLVCTSIQKREVFGHTHAGVRMDHVGGLYDPLQYLKDLKTLLRTPFMVVEKILAPGEELSSRWPVGGTTGYDFLNQFKGVFCKTFNRKRFDHICSDFTGQSFYPEEMVYQKKKAILEKHMQGEVVNLCHLLLSAVNQPWLGDITPPSLNKAIVAMLSVFPVYRTYTAEGTSVSDLKYIEEAFRGAVRHEPGLKNELTLLKKALCGPGHKQFRVGFQQYSLNPTSIHDTKRGEDARSRIDVPSEIPGQRQQKLAEWKEKNRSSRTAVGCPDLNDEYFLYQAILGRLRLGSRLQTKDGTIHHQSGKGSKGSHRLDKARYPV